MTLRAVASSSGGGSGNVTVGTSTITGGTDTRVLYDNAGVLGEYVITGTGNVVMSTSPTLVTPILGTPTSGTLTNCTLPVGGITGLGTGIATWLATPSSANLGSALTDKTGTGLNVFQTSPSLVTPALGVATATSLAIGGATIGTDALAVTGTVTVSGAVTLTTKLAAAQGGTGFGTYAVGDILYADTTTTLAKLADVATGSVLVSGGVGVAPSWSTTITGTVLQANTLRTDSSSATSNFGTASQISISAANSSAGLLFAGASNVQFRAVFNGTNSSVLTANTSYSNVIFGASPITEATSGTHALLANVAINAPTFTNGSATTTDATSLYIAGAPTGITPTNAVTSLWVAAGTSRFDGGVASWTSTAIPAGGTAGTGYKFSSTSNFGVFFGSGAPSLAAAQGSLYLRSDGSSTSTRLYVNTDGSTTWTNFVSAA